MLNETKDIENRINSIAHEVMIYSRNTLLVHLRFLDMALSRFQLEPTERFNLATDGRVLAYNPMSLIKTYKDNREQVIRQYLHVVMHCIFCHMFGTKAVDQRIWDLSCDLAVENAITELMLPCVSSPVEAKQVSEINSLKSKVKYMTAECLYSYFHDLNLSDEEINKLRSLFYADDHSLWYPESGDNQSQEQSDEDSDASCNNGDSNENQKSSQEGIAADRTALEEDWKEISKRVKEDLSTFSKQRGDRAGFMMQNLTELHRERYDYSCFLRKFAVLGETMTVNDDEFDNIFYTYGMKLYGKMPLIEPLEYKEVKRIREFVIAIDTSGSVSGELVQSFLQKTYNILKQEESFFRKINLHIVQCDAEIQEDAKITSQESFDSYIKGMKIHGLGGTDFRPVFEYVEKLQEQGEFFNLGGLIYFTDGFGVFPHRQPSFRTAFAFVNDGMEEVSVPVWAMKIILPQGDILNY